MSRPARRTTSRILSPIFIAGLKIYARLTGQQRVRVLVFNEDGELMLIWETIGMGRWSLPGGGIKRREEPAVAAARELHEETGIKVPVDSLKFVGFFDKSKTGVGYDAHLFSVAVSRDQLPRRLYNPYEIVEISWFLPDILPSPLSPFVRLGLERLSKKPKI